GRRQVSFIHRNTASPRHCPLRLDLVEGNVEGTPSDLMDAAQPLASPADHANSVAWKLHREVVLLGGWGRAILLQVAHPLVARGVAEHTSFTNGRGEAFRRLQRTLHAMLALTFGSPEEAESVAKIINGIHDRVHGTLPVAAGSFPAGARYSAHDPALLAWVHATLVDSFLLTYELFVGPLTA